jgi:hypothetical protein
MDEHENEVSQAFPVWEVEAHGPQTEGVSFVPARVKLHSTASKALCFPATTLGTDTKIKLSPATILVLLHHCSGCTSG